MTDFLSAGERSKRMAAIRGRDTGPELLLRKRLYARGLRYQLYRKDLPGSPDLVFPGRRSVVFVHGCFWHRHDGCKIATMPKSNVDYWCMKFDKNIKRDRSSLARLWELGWRVIVVWECELSREKVDDTLSRVESALRDAG